MFLTSENSSTRRKDVYLIEERVEGEVVTSAINRRSELETEKTKRLSRRKFYSPIRIPLERIPRLQK